MLQRAMRFTEEEMDWQVPLAKGNAWIHTGRVLEGEAMKWPSQGATKTGRWLDAVWSIFRRGR